MSMRPALETAIPAETARVAHAVFPKGHPYLALRDRLGPLFADASFAALYAHQGPAALSPARLIVITLLQYREDLSDREAADAVRSRVDWKYLLGLPLDDPGFDASVLTEFRARLLRHDMAEQVLTTVLEHARSQGLLRQRGQQRTDSTRVVAAVRRLNRLQLVQETMRHVLDVLALVAPTWLRDQCDAAWQRRYASEFVQRLPTTDAGKEQLAAAIGQDGFRLLAAIDAPESPAMLRTLEAVSTVRTIWAQQYAQGDDGPHLRPSEQLAPAAELLASPYDLDARFSIRREEAWIGFLAHLTETCDPELPALVVQVTTTPATTADKTMLPGIQDDLATRELLPSIQLADMGYLEADLLTSSQERHGITLVGPMQPDSSWQARAAAGYALTDFSLDWEEQHATCPQGKTSSTWRAVLDHRKQEVIQIHFRRRDCRDCPAKARCTTADRRSLSVHPQAIHEARLQAQAAEATPAFRRLYQRRAGIEGTISTAIRQMDLRHARMRSFAKVQLEHLLLAASLNLARLAAWFLGRDPVRTRTRPFARLVTVPCSP